MVLKVLVEWYGSSWWDGGKTGGKEGAGGIKGRGGIKGAGGMVWKQLVE